MLQYHHTRTLILAPLGLEDKMMNNWFVVSLVILALWSGYLIPGNKATAIHGANVTMLIEALVFVAIAFVRLGPNFQTELAKVTFTSVALGTTMALMSGIGLMIQLNAISKWPEQMPNIGFITSLWGVGLMVITMFILVVLAKPEWLEGATAMTKTQLVGVAVTAVGLALANWQPSWSAKFSRLLDEFAKAYPG